MKKFRVVASYTMYCTVDIEAEDRDEAWDIAINLDGGSFDHDANSYGDWNIDEMIDITEEVKQ
jgi:hypothetical protein